MVHMIFKQQHRGPNTKLMISVFFLSNESVDLVDKTQSVILNDLAEVTLGFKYVSAGLMRFVQLRKLENRKNCLVHIKITSDNYNEQFFCSDGWVEIKIDPSQCNNRQAVQNYSLNTYSYYMEVNFTVNEILHTMPVLANRELYEDTDFTDFELQGDDGNIAVHKTMLLAHSDVFKAMAKGEWTEKIDGYIKMDRVTVQTLRHLKSYMYLGALPDEGLQSLLVLASRYLMDKLKADCVVKLVDTMKPEKFDEIVNLASQNNIPELIKALVFRIPDNVLNDIHQLKIDGKDDDKEGEQTEE